MASKQEDELMKIFPKATEHMRTIVGQLDSSQLLYFYARFKQVNEGPCNTQRPGFFDFQGKQKWDAWNSLGKKSKENAMTEYVTQLSNIDPSWEEKAGVKPSKSGLGACVSTMVNDECDLPDDQKTVFDWCKDGNINRVTSLLKNTDVNQKDAEGMALLHWACDRGLDEMAQLLLMFRADINITDADGQTPLHYAASCGHVSVVKTLLSEGAERSVTDSDGLTAAELSENTQITKLIEQMT